MNTYATNPLNSFRMGTYAKGGPLNSFGMNTYAKSWWGAGRLGGGPPASCKTSSKSLSSPSFANEVACPSFASGAAPFRLALSAPDFTLDVDSRAKLPFLVRAVEADRSPCRVAEGFGPDEATTTGPAVSNWSQVPIPARFAGDMKSRRI